LHWLLFCVLDNFEQYKENVSAIKTFIMNYAQ